MPEAKTSKLRSVRIPLDYYKKPDFYTRWRNRLSVIAAALVLAWIVTAFWPSKLATHGPLARVHATWDEQCEKCHVPFTPINGSGWSASFVVDSRASDAKCAECHKDAGTHHSNIKEHDEQACASCHIDHRGRDARLSEVADSTCVRCHRDLKDHTKSGTATFAESVTAFGSDVSRHPEFGLFKNGPPKDPGRLKFNHKRHMLRGQPNDGGEALKKVADLLPEFQARYRDPAGKDAEGIQLDCASCHRPVGDRTLAAATQSTSPGAAGRGGAYMARATFESDCVACHPLDYDAKLPPIRHGLQPAEVYDYLKGAYSALILTGDASGGDTPQAKRQAVPGRDNTPIARPEAERQIKQKIEQAQRLLLGSKRCAECHYYEDEKGNVAELPEVWDEKPKFRIARPNVKDIWLPHARFDHGSHTAVAKCDKCHPQAYPTDAKASTVALDVMIPQSGVCRECHTPHSTGTAASGATAGAGSNCIECHGYHNGDRASSSASAPTPPPARRVPRRPPWRTTCASSLVGRAVSKSRPRRAERTHHGWPCLTAGPAVILW
ncbi:MAG: cytochrome c3 family protein [Isosphaeraceae bacterium]